MRGLVSVTCGTAALGCVLVPPAAEHSRGRLCHTQHSRGRLCHKGCHRGYVLVMVLVLLAIAAAAMAGVCRASMLKAVRAASAADELQRRWTVLRCRAVLLPKAEAVLSRGEGRESEVRREIIVGGQPVTLVFGDEQAKANVNSIYRATGLAGAERVVRQVVGNIDHVAVELKPLPEIGRPDDEEPPPVFETLGQVFGHTPPNVLVNPPGSSITCSLTCWGDGSLMLRRASRAALRAACSRTIGGAQIDRLVQIRGKHPDLEIPELLDQLKLTESARAALDDLLVDESTCHSLWIICRSAERSWYDLSVQDDSSEAAGTPRVFSW